MVEMKQVTKPLRKTEDAREEDSRKHPHSKPLALRDIWKPPRVRQWVSGAVYYKEKEERQVSRFELAYDLVFSGIVHVLAEAAAVDRTGLGFIRFVLTYYPAYTIWVDVRDFNNVHGTDDIRMRLYIIISAILLYGFSANATGIQLPRTKEILDQIQAQPVSYGQYIHPAVKAAFAFYLIARAVRLLLYLHYAAYLPRFRRPLLIRSAILFWTAAIYFPLLFVTSAAAIVAIPIVAIVLDISSKFALAFGYRRKSLNDSKGSDREHAIPAYNHSFTQERTAQLVVIIFGEMAISSAYSAPSDQLGASPYYGRCALAALINFSLIWLYFDAVSGRTHIHALRRHWFSNIAFNLWHFPLTAAIICTSAVLHNVIPTNQVDTSTLWFFHISVAVILFSLATVGTLHRCTDEPGSSLLPRSIRLLVRFAGAALIAVLPLFTPNETLSFMAIVACILSAIVVIETLGKLGTTRVVLPSTPTSEQDLLRSESSLQKHWKRHEKHLSPAEKGEEDVGEERELDEMEECPILRAQRYAYTA